ncbi:hypothetical protein QBC38DRAFT_474202 [Podospora fimiseda]|uniref:Uncharacterized protein n=1 Tax=Podospora fimiseda TaxID=252190 RepID=A0AAN7GWW9_9PEZI|nr:hypothetical protein QBC38DRAFT_474202 [Podospora fimiseda]
MKPLTLFPLFLSLAIAHDDYENDYDHESKSHGSSSLPELINGTWICPSSTPNGVYCAGTSLETDIIIRCTNGIGQPGRCGNNLVGQPPVGNIGIARCWSTPSNNGTAACEKNCIVYASSGNLASDLTLSDCQPLYPPLPPPTSTTTSTEDCETTTTTPTYTTTEDCEETTTTIYTKPPYTYTKKPHYNTTTTVTYPPYPTGTVTVTTITGSVYTKTHKTKTTLTVITTETFPPPPPTNVPVGPTTTAAATTGVSPPPPVVGGASVMKGNSIGGLVFVMVLIGVFF